MAVIITRFMTYLIIPLIGLSSGPAWGAGNGSIGAQLEATRLLRPPPLRPIRRCLDAQGRTFSPDLSGLSSLCEELPDVCRVPIAHDALVRLQRRNTWGKGFIIGGIGGALLGAGLTVWGISDAVRAERHPTLPKPGPVRMLGSALLMLGGLGAMTAGYALVPAQDDVNNVVDLFNTEEKEPRIHWGIGPSMTGDGIMAEIQRRF